MKTKDSDYYATKLNRYKSKYNKFGLAFMFANVFLLIARLEDCISFDFPLPFLLAFLTIGTAFFFGIKRIPRT